MFDVRPFNTIDNVGCGCDLLREEILACDLIDFLRYTQATRIEIVLCEIGRDAVGQFGFFAFLCSLIPCRDVVLIELLSLVGFGLQGSSFIGGENTGIGLPERLASKGRTINRSLSDVFRNSLVAFGIVFLSSVDGIYAESHRLGDVTFSGLIGEFDLVLSITVLTF